MGDLPFGSYETGARDAVISATRMLKEGGMDAVKLEGVWLCGGGQGSTGSAGAHRTPDGSGQTISGEPPAHPIGLVGAAVAARVN